MVHDYWRYVDDPDFVKQMLPGVRSVLGLLLPAPQRRRTALLDAVVELRRLGGSLARWPSAVEAGVMPATIHLQFLLALQWATELEAALGFKRLSEMAAEQAKQLASTIRATFWDPSRKIFSEDRAHQKLSQHANALAVIATVSGGEEARDLMTRVEADKSLAKCSVYFRYYLDRAMVHAGLGDRYLERLGTWEFMLAEGLSTWAEQDSPYTRSDCHAWGASPNIEFFRNVLGIDSAGPGFNRVVIEPHLGKLTRASGSMPHPRGAIAVNYDGSSATIELPPGVSGVLKWKGREQNLRPGRNQV